MKKTTKVYISLTFICLTSLICVIYVSQGAYIPFYFYGDELDTGMDFFNSLAESASSVCYLTYHVAYPPFINEILHKCAIVIPGSLRNFLPKSHLGIVLMRGTARDFRCHQAPMLLFILFIMTYIVLTFCIIVYKFRDHVLTGLLLSVSVLFSCGSLSGLERGNTVLLSFVFSMVFLFGYDSERIWIRRLSFLALAAAASLKLYPALYGLMIFGLKDRLSEIMRLICIAVSSALMLSFYPLRHFGGLQGLKCYLADLVAFNSDVPGTICYRYGIRGIVEHFASDLYKHTGLLMENKAGSAGSLLIVILTALTISFAIHVYLRDNAWRAAGVITLALILLQPQSTDYTLIFFVPVLLMLFHEEDDLKIHDIPLFILLMVFILPFPTPRISDAYNTMLRHVDLVQFSLMSSACYEFLDCMVRYVRYLMHHDSHTHHGPHIDHPIFHPSPAF